MRFWDGSAPAAVRSLRVRADHRRAHRATLGLYVRLTAEEFDAYVEAPMSDDERREILRLIEWFRRRYPRPLDRLVSARSAYARAAKRFPPGAM
jgi:hypothetical protein